MTDIQTDSDLQVEKSDENLSVENLTVGVCDEDEKKRALSNLETRRKELEFLIHDIQTEKTRHNRTVRNMVRILQQEILSRGRGLAKEIEQRMDERITQVRTQLTSLDNHILHLKQDTGKLNSEGNEETISKFCEFSESPMSMPPRDPFQIDITSITDALGELKVTMQGYVEEPFPDREEVVKQGVSLEVSGVGIWGSQRPTFFLMPRQEGPMDILYRYSLTVRMAYLSDPSWLTFQDSGDEPVVGNQVFACHPDDRNWYRGEVVKNMAKQSSVRFVDYGEIKTVDWSLLLPSRKDLYTDRKPWAFECVLVENIDTKQSQDARWFFNETLFEIARHCAPLKCTPQKQVEIAGEKVWLVDLTVAHTDGTIMDLGQEVKDRMSYKAQSRIGSRDIREEFQTQLSDIEKERQLKKAQKEKDKLQKQQAEKAGADGKSDSGSAETQMSAVQETRSVAEPASEISSTPPSQPTSLTETGLNNTTKVSSTQPSQPTNLTETDSNDTTKISSTPLSQPAPPTETGSNVATDISATRPSQPTTLPETDSNDAPEIYYTPPRHPTTLIETDSNNTTKIFSTPPSQPAPSKVTKTDSNSASSTPHENPPSSGQISTPENPQNVVPAKDSVSVPPTEGEKATAGE